MKPGYKIKYSTIPDFKYDFLVVCNYEIINEIIIFPLLKEWDMNFGDNKIGIWKPKKRKK